jgi:hypothetical protein
LETSPESSLGTNINWLEPLKSREQLLMEYTSKISRNATRVAIFQPVITSTPSCQVLEIICLYFYSFLIHYFSGDDCNYVGTTTAAHSGASELTGFLVKALGF